MGRRRQQPPPPSSPLGVRNQADRLRVALELQLKRCSEAVPGGPFDPDVDQWKRTMVERGIDVDFFLIALRRFIRLADWVVRADFATSALRACHERFQEEVSVVIDLRDIQEHFDEYLAGVGKLQRAGEEQSGWGYGVGASGGTVTYGGRMLNLDAAMSAAQEFHRAIRAAVDEPAARDPHGGRDSVILPAP